MTDALSPDRLAEDGRAVLALLVDHLKKAQAREGPVVPPGTPSEVCALFPSTFSKAGDGRLVDVIARAMSSSTMLQSPRFVGHQVATPLPAAALCDLVASFLNNGMAVWEMGKSAAAMERAVLRYFADLAGLPKTASGILTSGGSLGNFTALLAARQARAGFDPWRRGLSGQPQLAVLVADSAHYSVARAARMLGLGDDGVVGVDVDADLRMRVDALEAAIALCRKQKKKPIAVVASAGATAAGTFDPIDAIADVCEREDLWLHVDGAHGASLLVSDTHRSKLHGVHRADSIVWDAHKLMMMPALVTAVLWKDAKPGAAAFAQDAGYLFDDNDTDDAWSDIGKRTVECTKRMMGLKLYACLSAYGTDHFAHHVDHCCALTTAFARLARARGLEVLVEPECNIVCFRPKGMDGGKIAALRRQILDDGRFYLVQLHRKDGLWLRCTISHPLTTEQDLSLLLDLVQAGLSSGAS